MATTYLAEGDVLTVTAPYAVASGVGCLVGSIFGVTLAAASSGAAVQIMTEGIWTLAKLSTDVNAVGELAYWDDTNKRVTESSSGNKLIGVFVATAGNGVTTCTVRLNGAFVG